MRIGGHRLTPPSLVHRLARVAGVTTAHRCPNDARVATMAAPPLVVSSIHLPIHPFIHPSIHLTLNERVLEDSTHVLPEVRNKRPCVTDSFQTSASPRNVPHQNVDPHPYIYIYVKAQGRDQIRNLVEQKGETSQPSS